MKKVDDLISKKKKELEDLKNRLNLHINNIQRHQKEAQEIDREIQMKIGELKSLTELQE